MEVEIFTVCDLFTEKQGKNCIVGFGLSVRAASFPGRGHGMAFVRLRFDPTDTEETPIQIRVIDEDAQPMGPPMNLSHKPQWDKPDFHEWADFAHITFPLDQVVFPHPGTFWVALQIGNESQRRLRLPVLRAVSP